MLTFIFQSVLHLLYQFSQHFVQRSAQILPAGMLVVLAIVLASPGAAWAAAEAVATIGYEQCQAADDQAFKAAIETTTIDALTKGLKDVDYKAAVDAEWRRLGFDEIIDRQVDLAVEEVRNETSFGSLIKSLADQQKAQELATAVAERVYKSAAMTTAIETLASGVATEIGKRIELATEDATGPALACLKTYLGPRYGSAVAASVTGSAADDLDANSNTGRADVSTTAVLKQSSEGITGAALIIMRRQLANMTRRIGQRIAGSVAARLVSVAAGGVGLVLLAKDIWELRNGVLPIVAEEMKAKDTKDKVKIELASSLDQEIGVHIKEIGGKTAEHVIEIWQNFRAAHAKALDLAERNLPFKTLLDTVRPEHLPRLDELTGLVLASEGEPGVLKRVSDGTLSTAITTLDEPGLTIARETRSIDKAMAWAALAGKDLGSVVQNGLYRRADASEFSQGNLRKVLELGDSLAIAKLGALGREARTALLDLDPVKLKSLTRGLTESELTTLSGYLTGLQSGPRDRILEAVAETPAKFQMFASERLRQAVLASADQAAAVEMLLRPGGTSTGALANDFSAAWNGRIAPVLLWDKHPLTIIGLCLAALILLLWFKRLFGAGRA